MPMLVTELKAGKLKYPRICPRLEISPGVYELCERGAGANIEDCGSCRIPALLHPQSNPELAMVVLYETLYHVDEALNDYQDKHDLRKMRTTRWHWMEAMQEQWRNP